MMRKNKKGIAGIFIIGILVLILLIIYIFLFIPIPSFSKIRALINYILSVLFWIVFQIGLIMAYYYIGKFAVRGFNLYRKRFQNSVARLKNYLILRGR